jgi:DNA (cytosine-5)-methyltransferase 1
VVLGGFPCQGFSKAGPKNVQDKRNTLYLEMKNAIFVLEPEVFIAENVDGISQNFQGVYLERIIEDFREIGYTVEYRILDAVSFGLPQHRRRIFFVGTKQAAQEKFLWPEPTHLLKRRNGEFKITEMYAPQQPSLWQAAINDRQKPQRVLAIKDAIGDLRKLDDNIPDHKIVNKWPRKYIAIFRAIKEGQKLCNVRHADTSVYTWQIPDVFGAVSKREQLVLETIAKHRRHKKYGNIPNGNPLSLEEIEALSGLSDVQQDIESLLVKGYIKIKMENMI